MKEKSHLKKDTRKCFIITAGQKRKHFEKIKKYSRNIVDKSRKALVIGTTIAGISLYSGPLLAKEISLGKGAGEYTSPLNSSDFIILNYSGEAMENVVASNMLPEYEKVYELSEGMAKVKINGKFGFLNDWGNLAITPYYDDATKFSENFAGVKVGDKWGYINKAGELVIEPQFEEAGNFSEGLASVKIIDKWGYINKAGKVVISPQFDRASDFLNGEAYIEVEEKCGYIDAAGKFLKFGNPRPEELEECTASCIACTSGCTQACTVVTSCHGCVSQCVSCTNCLVCTACTKFTSPSTPQPF